jgi:hypothetical protein
MALKGDYGSICKGYCFGQQCIPKVSTCIPKRKIKKVPMVNKLSWVLTLSSLKTFLVGICNISLLILHRFRPIIFWGLIIICVPSAIFLKTYFLILWDGSINHNYIVNCSIHFMWNSLSFDLRITCLPMTREQDSIYGRINKWLIVKCHFPSSIPFKSKITCSGLISGSKGRDLRPPKATIWYLQNQNSILYLGSCNGMSLDSSTSYWQ